MISLHRLGHQAEEFHLNPDLIVTVEANPDTVVTLTTGTKVVVAEPPDRVVEEIRDYRIGDPLRCAQPAATGRRSPSRTASTRAAPRRACCSRSTVARPARRTRNRTPSRSDPHRPDQTARAGYNTPPSIRSDTWAADSAPRLKDLGRAADERL